MSEISEILTKLGYSNLRSFSGYFRVDPLYRSSDNKGVLSINANDGRFQDWARQGLPEGSGDLTKLISIHFGCSYKEAQNWLKKENYQIKNQNEEYSTEEIYEQTGIDVPFFCSSNLKKTTPNHEYWLKRNASIEVLEKLNGGLDDGIERGKMQGRYVFPIFDASKKTILGFAGRDTTNKSKMKWKLIGRKNSWAYPFFLSKQDIIKKSQVIIVESIGDMLSLMSSGINNVLVCFGLSMGKEISSLLINLKIKDIVLSFNNDSEGNSSGNTASLKAFKTIKKNTNKTCKICLPTGKNDFGEMNPQEIKLWAKENEIYI